MILSQVEPLASEAQLLSREIFGNIPPSHKATFYGLATLAMLIFAWGIIRRVRIWRLGQPGLKIDWQQGLNRFCCEVLTQKVLLGRGLPSLAHVLLFSGFVVLFIGTILVAVEHILQDLQGLPNTQPVFHYGIYYAVYEVVLDTFGLAFIAGCLLFAYRRAFEPGNIERKDLDWLVLLTFAVIGVTGYFIEGARIIREATPQPGFSYVGLAFAHLIEWMGIRPDQIDGLHRGLWWFHAFISLSAIAVMPFTRLLHVFAGSLNWLMVPKEMGVLQPISIEEIEETGQMGVARLQDWSWQRLLQLDACVSCGRCEDACPAHLAGKPLSPRDVVQDIKLHAEEVDRVTRRAKFLEKDLDEVLESASSLHVDTIQAETLWSCTTCNACVFVCPLGVNPLGYITDMRRNLIGEAELRGAPAQALQKMQRSGNPWGLPVGDRFEWAEGLDVPTVESNPDFDVLYWVGCAAAYDRRLRKVAQSIVKLLAHAGVSFAVLGEREKCTGESARRMGEEFLFQELAMENVETLNSHNVKKIVTHCPHCLNSFRQDYPQFDGHYEVVHHTAYLQELIEAGKLQVPSDAELQGKVTFHDPCYLARVQGETEAPRELLDSVANSPSARVEMENHSENTLCCGGGGGRMWFDDAPEERTGKARVQEALNTGAEQVAVSCPFCLIMMKDGVAAEGKDEEVKVLDVAEVLVGQTQPDPK